MRAGQTFDAKRPRPVEPGRLVLRRAGPSEAKLDAGGLRHLEDPPDAAVVHGRGGD